MADRPHLPWAALAVSAIGHCAAIAMLMPAATCPAGLSPAGVLVVRWTAADRPDDMPAQPVRTRQVLAPKVGPKPMRATDLAIPATTVSAPATASAAEPASQDAAGGPDPEPTPLIAPQFDVAYLTNPVPPYPPASRAMGEQGEVFLDVHVSSTGEALNVRLRTGSGFARLDAAALETVRHWKFLPARRGDEAVAAWVVVPVAFRLRH